MIKAVITTLGMINYNKVEYIFNGKKHQNINTFPLLIECYKDDYEIIAIATDSSLKVQKEVLEKENIDNLYLDDAIIIPDSEEYDNIFKTINDVLNDYDEVIIDISHGFRHTPILIIINLIVQNIVNPNKIKAILFAKEIERNTKYEIKDLVSYLDLSNIAFTLARFSENYTVSKNVNFRDKTYKVLVDNLSEFSLNLLGNSIKNLTQKDSKNLSLIERIIKNIDELQKKDTKIQNLQSYLNTIKEHLQDMQNYAKLDAYKMIYQFAKIMNEKWYMLNAITLLNEALGLYSMQLFQTYDSSINKHFTAFKATKKQALYYLSSESSTLIKKQHSFNTSSAKVIKEQSYTLIMNELKIIKSQDKIGFEAFKQLNEDVSNMRNNLAHANSGEAIKKVQNEIKSFIQKYETLCITQNILQKRDKEKTVELKEITPPKSITTKSGLRIKKKI